MASLMPQPGEAPTVTTDLSPAGLTVLTRLATEDGATRAEIARDLNGLVARASIEPELTALAAAGFSVEKRGRLTATETGGALVAQQLGTRTPPKHWRDVRDVRLVAKALGLEHASGSRIKALARPEDLRAEIVARAFRLKHRAAATPSRLRAELAVVALERAFGNRIKGGLGAGAGSGFAPKAGRLLASQLLDKPRDLGTDARLIAALAAEHVGARSADADALRTALLKAWLGKAAHEPTSKDGVPRVQPAPAPAKAPVPVAPAVEPPREESNEPAEPSAAAMGSRRPAAANRPDLPGFVREVQRAAAEKAQGWPGNRKAYIVHVFELLAHRHPGWGLSEIEFKAMLAEAHRTGHLALATADLRDKSQMRELTQSAIAYKNTVWHLVRVAE
jgi:hypothetical protein